jgi:hypothetical protein
MSASLPPSIRNRIVRHVRIRAGDLVAHELNPRRHPTAQRQALVDLYTEVGFARSLLAFAMPDGRLKLIDGHLRQQLDPEMEVDVEVLDVSEEEARKLLLSIDPLTALAENDTARLDELRKITETGSDALANLWRSIDAATALQEATEDEIRRKPAPPPAVPEQYFVLVECTDEAAQLALLERFQQEGLSCRALLS